MAQPQATAQFGRRSGSGRPSIPPSTLKGRLQPVTGVPAQPRRPQDGGMKAAAHAGRTPRSLLATAWRHRPEPFAGWALAQRRVRREVARRQAHAGSLRPNVERIAKYVPQPQCREYQRTRVVCQRLLADVLDAGRSGTRQSATRRGIRGRAARPFRGSDAMSGPTRRAPSSFCRSPRRPSRRSGPPRTNAAS